MDRHEPISCSLPVTQISDRLRKWEGLRDPAESIQSLPDGVRIVLPASMEASAHELAAKERSCCAFLDITVTAPVAERVFVDVTARDRSADVIISAIAHTDPKT